MSGFKKGHAKVGGRQKGTPNKKRIPKAADFLAENDFNPIAEILEILAEDKKKPLDKQMWPSVRAGICFDLMSYVQAKPKEIEKDDAGDLLDDVGEVSEETILKLINSETA